MHIKLTAEIIPPHARRVSVDVVIARGSRGSRPDAQSAMGIETDPLNDDFLHPEFLLC